MGSTCAACGKPVPDVAYVCPADERDLATALHAAADLLPELDVAVAKLVRWSAPGPRARGSAPAQPIRPGLGDPADDHQPGYAGGLPVDLRASEVRAAVINTVSTWARVVVDERGGAYPGESGEAMRWLAGQLGWARYQRWADECWSELAYAARLVRPAVDRPIERVDAGVCCAPTPAGPCQQRLTTPRGSSVATCPACGAHFDAAARQDLLMAKARDLRGTATELARWLTLLGLPTPADTVHKWARRGRLLGAGGLYAFRDAEKLRLRNGRSAT